jgi:hypothetical protein
MACQPKHKPHIATPYTANGYYQLTAAPYTTHSYMSSDYQVLCARCMHVQLLISAASIAIHCILVRQSGCLWVCLLLLLLWPILWLWPGLCIDSHLFKPHSSEVLCRAPARDHVRLYMIAAKLGTGMPDICGCCACMCLVRPK